MGVGYPLDNPTDPQYISDFNEVYKAADEPTRQQAWTDFVEKLKGAEHWSKNRLHHNFEVPEVPDAFVAESPEARVLIHSLLKAAPEGTRLRMEKRLDTITNPTWTDGLEIFVEEAGAAKLGQLLANRPDVPDEVRTALKKTESGTIPTDPHEAKLQMESEMGTSLESIFQTIHLEPAHAASIAQVHFGTLKSGQEVAAKLVVESNVKRNAQLEKTLKNAAHAANSYPVTFPLSLTSLASYFSSLNKLERDLRREVIHEELLSPLFRQYGFATPHIIPPTEYLPAGQSLPASTRDGFRRLLIMEKVNGVPLDEVKDPIYKTDVMTRLLQFVAEGMFDHGMYFGDVHGGQLLVDEENKKSVILDRGNMEWMTRDQTQRWAKLLFVTGAHMDSQTILEALHAVANADASYSEKLVLAEIDKCLDNNFEIGTAFLGQLLAKISPLGFDLESPYMAAFRTLALVEGYAKAVTPDLSLPEVFLPHILNAIQSTVGEYKAAFGNLVHEVRQGHSFTGDDARENQEISKVYYKILESAHGDWFNPHIRFIYSFLSFSAFLKEFLSNSIDTQQARQKAYETYNLIDKMVSLRDEFGEEMDNQTEEHSAASFNHEAARILIDNAGITLHQAWQKYGAPVDLSEESINKLADVISSHRSELRQETKPAAFTAPALPKPAAQKTQTLELSRLSISPEKNTSRTKYQTTRRSFTVSQRSLSSLRSHAPSTMLRAVAR